MNIYLDRFSFLCESTVKPERIKEKIIASLSIDHFLIYLLIFSLIYSSIYFRPWNEYDESKSSPDSLAQVRL